MFNRKEKEMEAAVTLNRLEIEKERYGALKGQYVGKVSFVSGTGAEVRIPLDDTLSRKVLAVCAEEVVAAGKSVAGVLVQDVIDSNKLLPSNERG